MAYKLALETPKKGAAQFSFLYNVSEAVGWKSTNANRPTDVELVQFLIKELKSLGEFPNVEGPPVNVTGRYDVATGYWIFRKQIDGPSSFICDGVVSPVTAANRMSRVLTWFNFRLFMRNPQVYANLPSDPRLSPALRAELASAKS